MKCQRSLPIHQITPYLASLVGDLISTHIRHPSGERPIHIPPGTCCADREAHALTWDKRKLSHDLRGHYQVTSGCDHDVDIRAGSCCHVTSPPAAAADPTWTVACLVGIQRECPGVTRTDDGEVPPIQGCMIHMRCRAGCPETCTVAEVFPSRYRLTRRRQSFTVSSGAPMAELQVSSRVRCRAGRW